MDTWLLKQIEEKTGLPNGTRAAWARRCRTCREITITGLNDDVCAFTTTVDPTPLGTLGEALARMSGRQTFSLHHDGPKRFRISRRDRWQIAGHPAGRQGILPFDVVTEHHCRTPPLPSIPSELTRTERFTSTDDQPPF